MVSRIKRGELKMNQTTDESWEEFESWETSCGFREKPVPMGKYNYKHRDGRAFLCVAPSLEEARFRRDVWLGLRTEGTILMELVSGRHRMLVREDFWVVEIATFEDSGDVEVYYYAPDEAVHSILLLVRSDLCVAGHPAAWAGWSLSEGTAGVEDSDKQEAI